MATFNPQEYKCQFCKTRASTGCEKCSVEENRRIIHKFVGIRKIVPSTLPPKTKKIDGKRYKLAGRYETNDAATKRAGFLRQLHTHRIGYSLRVVALPRTQWGLDWDRKPFALYVLYGRVRIQRKRLLSNINSTRRGG